VRQCSSDASGAPGTPPSGSTASNFDRVRGPHSPARAAAGAAARGRVRWRAAGGGPSTRDMPTTAPPSRLPYTAHPTRLDGLAACGQATRHAGWPELASTDPDTPARKTAAAAGLLRGGSRRAQAA
jgi:hypothetical protein